MQWNQSTMEKENQVMGQQVHDHQSKSMVQKLLADNSLEFVPVSKWRRAQLWRLIKTHGTAGVPSTGKAQNQVD